MTNKLQFIILLILLCSLPMSLATEQPFFEEIHYNDNTLQLTIFTSENVEQKYIEVNIYADKHHSEENYKQHIMINTLLPEERIYCQINNITLYEKNNLRVINNPSTIEAKENVRVNIPDLSGACQNEPFEQLSRTISADNKSTIPYLSMKQTSYEFVISPKQDKKQAIVYVSNEWQKIFAYSIIKNIAVNKQYICQGNVTTYDEPQINIEYINDEELTSLIEELNKMNETKEYALFSLNCQPTELNESIQTEKLTIKEENQSFFTKIKLFFRGLFQ